VFLVWHHRIVGLSLKPQHLKRYKDVALLLIKYGRLDLVKAAGLDATLEDEGEAGAGAEPAAVELADDLERMGPTFIKLGQLLSTRPDILPPAYLHALTRLQDRVEQFSFGETERIVAGELGIRLSRAFSEFEATPVAAASLGQVYRAAMRDGRRVAVKVQRPDIRERVAEDLDALEEIAEFLDEHTEAGRRYEFRKIVNEFRRSLLRELDYRQEAQNLTMLRRNLAEFDRIVVPAPIDDYTTSRVLTMEYISGTKITLLSPVARLELAGAELAEQLFRAYLKQILVDGFFHADPHPGNVLVTDDGKIGLIDLGMVARVIPRVQEQLLQLLLAISEGQSDDAVRFAIKLGEAREQFDEPEFARRVSDLVGRHRDAELRHIHVGTAMLEIGRAAGDTGLRLPTELALLGKTLLNLDQIGELLDPKFNPNASIRRNAAQIMRARLVKSASPGNLFSGILEMKDFVERLPARVNKILDVVANNQLAVKVDAIDEARLMAGFQKVANRITMGLLLAALIVGAALLMRIETEFRILGYPGLAIVFFLLATGGGVALMLSILFKDE
jgi:predicted unusual protein kinase regulating ubiquinone biosynthesis (AarF/ABC1/UbiB family)